MFLSAPPLPFFPLLSSSSHPFVSSSTAAIATTNTQFLRICNCNVRMVALDSETGRPNGNIPDLNLTEEELEEVRPLRGTLSRPGPSLFFSAFPSPCSPGREFTANNFSSERCVCLCVFRLHACCVRDVL